MLNQTSQCRSTGRRKDATNLPQLSQIYLQRLRIILKPKTNHSVQNILPTNRLSLLRNALLRCFGGNEADEFRNAFLDAFFCFFCYLGAIWHRVFHYAGDVCYLHREVRSDGELLYVGDATICHTGRYRSCSLYSPSSSSVKTCATAGVAGSAVIPEPSS
jgi:hypothetical protein